MRHDKIGELRSSSSGCSADEWESILKALLLGAEPIEGVEAGAEANVGKSITITIRRKVAGINVCCTKFNATNKLRTHTDNPPQQRLGSLTLNHKADEAIQLFDWCGAAALQREKFQETVTKAKFQTSSLEANIAELRSQLDELTASKKASETEMLEKFCILLNEKKVKIREQQRLLSTAQVDPSKLDVARASQAARSTPAGERKPAPSRRAKRKASEDASGGSSSSDSDDGFEKPAASKSSSNAVADKMDIDQTESEHEPSRGTRGANTSKDSPESEDRETTDDDGTETASEPDEESAPPPPPPKARHQKKPEPAKGRAVAAAGANKGSKGKDVVIHPRRPVRRAKAATPPPAEGSETESDDEL